MRGRIATLSRLTLLGVALITGLVIVAWRLSGQTPQRSTSASPIHAERNVAIQPSMPAGVGPRSPTVTPSGQPIKVPIQLPAAPPLAPTPTVDVSHRIGLLAGHWGYDTGAICADGLREVDITVDIARRVAGHLHSLGYTVDILPEQDPDRPGPPLQDYRASAFVSLHVDSCLPGATGFKVARWAFSQIPDIEDRLVQCLYREYAATTGLPHHDASITIDMWNYYAFRELGKPTPGAIIELGFMSGDRWLLVSQPDLAAQGVTNGILCFLGNKPAN